MTQKKTDNKPTKVAAKRKTASAGQAGLKAAPPRKRIRKKVEVVSESDVEQKAYALWQSRGCPMGSPEVDWYNAKEQLGLEM